MTEWRIRGIRGAITVDENTREAIIEAAQELIETILRVNQVPLEDIASVILTLTSDLNAEFPAVGARLAGLTDVPLLCATEIDVPNGQPRCLRVLMHVNTTRSQKEMRPVYLKGAVALRPDLAHSEA